MSGTVVPLSEVPDPVYAEGLLGPGLAIAPDDPDGPGRSLALAPCAGRVSAAHPHAVTLDPDIGRSLLLHLGVGNRRLQVDAFDTLTMPGRHVRQGQPVLVWSPADLRSAGGSTLTPVVAMRADPVCLVHLVGPGDRVEEGQPLLLWS